MTILVRTGILTVLYALLARGALLEGPIQKQTDLYRAHISVIYDLIAEECPSKMHEFRRQLTVEDRQNHLKVYTQLYKDLLKELVECRKPKGRTTEQTTSMQHLPTTTVKQQQTTSETPIQCRTARNLTESWRADPVGSDFKPGGLHSSIYGYACDFHKDFSQWFRFTGKAGNKMLDFCPERYSCGTQIPFWTDEPMPTAVGVETEIKAYGVYLFKCKMWSENIKVMRCSWDVTDDFIYKQTANVEHNCQQAFCGMFSRQT